MKKVIAMNGRVEQMDDLIKRQDAITVYCEHECGIKGMTRENCGATDCGTIFDDIPSAQQWIPCSERQPEAGKYVLRTIRKFGWHGEEYWSVDIGPYNTNDGSIIAWMPRPEPYKGEEI